jgi:golgi to ER traffic protein 4
MSAKIEKIIVRLQEKYFSFPILPMSQTHICRITEGQYYEAQQQTRVVAARYIKSKTWDAAIDILFSVSQSLLKVGQGGSGGDLGLFLIDVYRQAELKPDAGNKGKLLVLLRLFDPEEPTRKRFIGEMIGYVFICCGEGGLG